MIVIERLSVNNNIIPLNRKSIPNEATKDESLKTTIKAQTIAPIIAPVKIPDRIAIAGSIPVLTIIAKTYAATA